MTAVFLYGTLCHAPLLAAVLGRVAVTVAGSVAGTVRASGTAALWSTGAGRVDGRLLVGLQPDDHARLAFFAAVLGQAAVPCRVEQDAGAVDAVLFTAGAAIGADTGAEAGADTGAGGPEWSLAAWERRFGPAAVAAAQDVMAQFGQAAPAALARRYGQMLGRGAARVRAAHAGPVTLRRAQAADDLRIDAVARPYGDYFAVEEHDLRFRRFDGGFSDRVKRAAFVMGDAVTVLPYDPVRDRVLLIEQFRAAPYVRGDAECWSLEAIAGRIDPGETPQDAARREAVEEAGLALGALERVGGYYPSPGAVTEYLYSYVALVDLPDGAAGVFGVEGEAEDIRGHLVGFDRLMELVASGEVDNAPLLLTALWLQRERARLRAG